MKDRAKRKMEVIEKALLGCISGAPSQSSPSIASGRSFASVVAVGTIQPVPSGRLVAEERGQEGVSPHTEASKKKRERLRGGMGRGKLVGFPLPAAPSAKGRGGKGEGRKNGGEERPVKTASPKKPPSSQFS